MISLLVIAVIILVILGMPLFAGLLAAAMLGLYVSGVEFMAIPIEIARLANAPILLAIPLFTFAGYRWLREEVRPDWSGFQKAYSGGFPGDWVW